MIVFISAPTYRITTITTNITAENNPTEHTNSEPRIPASFVCPKRDKDYIHRPVKEYGHTRPPYGEWNTWQTPTVRTLCTSAANHR